ncbi:MAG TPA: polyphosphate:AMP phosphotransferase [Polyangiaceae bacterium]|jgi:polyphosphate:AMP phosphotransferase|nr:polyphosphate:AMP phosphotransferase [Polyangiaceae bacterium]
MFESAELGHKISKEAFAEEEPKLREELLDVQYELLDKAPFSVVVVVGGVDGAGKGELVNLLYEWMDPRHLVTHPIEDPTAEELQRPEMFRFWQRLPPRGKIALFLGSWYTAPIIDRVYGKLRAADLDKHLEEINRFERMLSNERVLVLKFWLHLSKKAQKRRLRELEEDPNTAWRVTPLDWERFDLYDRFRRISERSLRITSTQPAPWYVIESVDEEYRALSVGRIVRDAIKKRLAEPTQNVQVPTPPLPRSIDGRDVIGNLDLGATIRKEQYDEQVPALQARIGQAVRSKPWKKRNAVIVFEGSDAAGKGGAIRRITSALDARDYRAIPIAAPTDEEKARPYLWRFWRNLPKRGRLAIFDRSWYGRVLVEKVEGFCDEDDWMRAYSEINDFEESLVASGAVVIKFWLQISADEQLRRFEERKATAFKRFKIGPEDWRNRDKWDAYQAAASEMIDRTSTEYAPWTMVEANDKRFARVKVLGTIADRLEAALV